MHTNLRSSSMPASACGRGTSRRSEKGVSLTSFKTSRILIISMLSSGDSSGLKLKVFKALSKEYVADFGAPTVLCSHWHCWPWTTAFANSLTMSCNRSLSRTRSSGDMLLRADSSAVPEREECGPREEFWDASGQGLVAPMPPMLPGGSFPICPEELDGNKTGGPPTFSSSIGSLGYVIWWESVWSPTRQQQERARLMPKTIAFN
mmetsp:Transcript_5646/g.13413  ORF Transcript_5646/g.13413 Transcript_5646/m.13413 type:complete len:205 (+) Transcript_5646:219-833(+)